MAQGARLEPEGHVVRRDLRTAAVQYERDLPQLIPLIRRRVLAATESFSRGLAPSVAALDGLQLVRYKPRRFLQRAQGQPRR